VCLIALAYRVHHRFPFIIAANRDEFMDRPAQPAHCWSDAPHIFAGRDVRAGGTWLGITHPGRFAAITNYRDLRRVPVAGPSRGQLVRAALEGLIDPASTNAFEGFNLLYGPLQALRYHNNIQPVDEPLAPGIHGLSNHYLNTPWPKVQRATAEMLRLVQEPDAGLVDGLFALLTDNTIAADDQLPDTGLPLPLERAASSIFIRSTGYGTRCSTVVLVDREGRVRFEERTTGGGQVMEEFVLAEQRYS
jgi:uncharacterized protein with NRDE domain